MPQNFTESFLRNIKPPEAGRDEYSDSVRQGLRLRVTPSGRRTWMYEKRIRGGMKRKHTLGTYPGISLKDARAAALELQVEAERGFDRVLAAIEAEKERDIIRNDQMPVREALRLYDELQCSSLKSRYDVMRALNEALAPYMDVPLESLTRADLQAFVDNKAKTAPTQANRSASYLHKFSKFAWNRGYQSEHIALGIEKPTKEKPRDRVLSLDEMKRIHRASYECGTLWGPLLRLLILTAQRRRQIGNLKWREVDFDAQTITFGVSRTKNNEWNHFVHIPSLCMHELRRLRQISLEKWGETGLRDRHVFTSTGTTPPSGYGKFKARLDKMLGSDFEHWTFHDLRTGFATIMCEEGCDEEIVDRILNHAASSSASSAVSRIYNRSRHLDERRSVIEDWEEILTELPSDSDISYGDETIRILAPKISLGKVSK
ncbi:tyrosine-type recombinase/integrase [Sulfitobacter sp. W074]|uniref:tyrosine-type recombinase/integrase n=1 Tax=Sulfitobacter sp. W074 TaxID=2867026 RepID=UPI0021A2ABAD|nr:tyrosine-type recombinase/integrase [Sulfitobacter sp. W074]UWR37675.1 tyrosine-type recombinase/integrase [Sulfitobacter sp. W074]